MSIEYSFYNCMQCSQRFLDVNEIEYIIELTTENYIYELYLLMVAGRAVHLDTITQAFRGSLSNIVLPGTIMSTIGSIDFGVSTIFVDLSFLQGPTDAVSVSATFTAGAFAIQRLCSFNDSQTTSNRRQTISNRRLNDFKDKVKTEDKSN